MVVLPQVLVWVDVVLVDIVPHVGMGENILQFGVVVVGYGSEWVEDIWVNWASLQHAVPFSFLCCFVSLGLPGGNHIQIEYGDCGVEGQVSGVAHSSKSAECVSSHFYN